jgi:hypothetical protein
MGHYNISRASIVNATLRAFGAGFAVEKHLSFPAGCLSSVPRRLERWTDLRIWSGFVRPVSVGEVAQIDNETTAH